MSCRTRTLWLITLCAFLSGCATYQPITESGTVPNLEPRGRTQNITEGSNVRVTLLSGEKFIGKVTRLTSETLVLGSRGNYGHEDVAVAIADIELIEVRIQSDAHIERRWFVALASALVVSAIYGLRQLGGS